MGNLFDLLGEVCPKKFEPSYSVGDWVWARHHGSSSKRFLARVEDPNPFPATRGRLLYKVRIYMAKRSYRGGMWSDVEHRRIECALDAKEIAHNRKLGIIPPAGESLP